MNKVIFCIQKSLIEDYYIVDISIDGFPLPIILMDYEAGYTSRLCIPELAGCYEGLPAIITLENCDHFEGRTIPEYIYENGRIVLMEYGQSGIPGDYSITCNIEVTEDKVIWKDFKNYSSIFHTKDWSYKGLSFSFDKNQYLSSLKTATLNYVC